MNDRHYLVFLDPGPCWSPGLPSRDQPSWYRHSAFMNQLFNQGRVVLGGPYADYSRVLVIVNAQDADEARGLFRDDPWNKASILQPSEVVEWRVFLDSRQRDR